VAWSSVAPLADTAIVARAGAGGKISRGKVGHLSNDRTVAGMLRTSVLGDRPEEASMNWTHACLALALLALPAGAAAPPLNPLRDVYGDTLPPGAVGRLGARPLRHDGRIAHLAFTPNGRRLFSYAGGAMCIWDASSGRRLSQLNLRGGDACRLSPDGRTLAGVAPDLRAVRLLDPATGEEVRRLEGHQERVTALAFSADNKWLATGSADETVRLWDTRSGLGRTLVRGVGESTQMAFSPDGRLLAGISTRGYLRVWEAATGKRLYRRKAPTVLLDGEPVRESFRALAFSPDGRSLLAATAAEACVHEARSGHCWARFRRSDRAPLRCVAWSPDGRTVALAGADVQLWQSGRLSPVDTLRASFAEIAALAFAPDGRKLAVDCVDGSMQLWDVPARRLLPPLPGHRGAVRAVAFAPDGRTVVTSTGSGLCLWRADQRLLACLPAPETPGAVAGGGLAFAPDGQTLIATQADGGLTAWSLKGEPPRRLAEGHPGQVHLRHTPDGKLLAVCDAARVVLRDARSGKLAGSITLPGAVRQGWSVQGRTLPTPAFSPRAGERLLAVPRGNALVLVDVGSGKVVQRFSGPGWQVRSVAFTPDGEHVVAGVTHHPETGASEQAGSSLRAWDVGTGEEDLALALAEPLTAVALSPDGQWLAVAGGAVRIWELASGQEVLRLRDPEARAVSLAFAPDGRRLIAGMTDGTALVWDVNPLGRAERGPLLAGESERLWADLGAPDARRAYRAAWRLAGAPGSARFLAGRLKPITKEDVARIERLMTDLAHEEFARRDAANRELRRLGDRAGHVLRAALRRPLDLEARRRIERLVSALSGMVVKEADLLRTLRGIAVLGWTGTPEARALLKKLAEGAPGARQTMAARAALGVLGRG
jgi:WD40 repeat protein